MPTRYKEEIAKTMKESLQSGNKEKLIEVSQKYDWIFVDGKYYEEVSKDGKLFWKEIDEKIIKDLEKKGEKVANRLVEHLNGQAVIQEALRKLAKEDVEKIHRMLFEDGKDYTIKTREGHCIDMKIGNFILPIIDGA